MQRKQGEPVSQHDHLDCPGPAAEDHGRAVTASLEAAACYRRAQRAVDRRQAVLALRLAVDADPAFEVAAADLDAIRGTSAQRRGGRQMNWERHHVEVVRTAASGNGKRAVDLLREHLAGVGCDPLAFQIVAQCAQREETDDDFENLAGQLPIATQPDGRGLGDGAGCLVGPGASAVTNPRASSRSRQARRATIFPSRTVSTWKFRSPVLARPDRVDARRTGDDEDAVAIGDDFFKLARSFHPLPRPIQYASWSRPRHTAGSGSGTLGSRKVHSKSSSTRSSTAVTSPAANPAYA